MRNGFCRTEGNMKSQRIWASIGVVLILVSIICMLVGLFTGAAKALLMQVSLVGFVGAAGILLALSIVRKRTNSDAENDKNG